MLSLGWSLLAGFIGAARNLNSSALYIGHLFDLYRGLRVELLDTPDGDNG